MPPEETGLFLSFYRCTHVEYVPTLYLLSVSRVLDRCPSFLLHRSEIGEVIHYIVAAKIFIMNDRGCRK